MSQDDKPIDFNLNNLAKEAVESNEKPELSVEDARHQSMMDAIAPYAKKVQQKNTTSI